MKKISTRAEQLLKYLEDNCLGWERLTDGARLARVFNISRSELNRLVTQLRRDERPIAGNGEGYCFAQNAGEIADTIDFLERYDAGIRLTIAGLRRGLRHFGRKP